MFATRAVVVNEGARRAWLFLASWRGVVAFALAMGAQWLLREAAPGTPFAPSSASQWFVTHAPGWLATEAIDRLGHRALPTLEGGAILSALGLGALLRRARPLVLAVAALALTLTAVYLDPISHGSRSTLEAALVGGGAAGATAYALSPRAANPARTDASPVQRLDPGRRHLVITTCLGLGLLGLGGAAVLRQVFRSVTSTFVLADRPLNVPVDPSFPEVPKLSSRVTSNKDHYVVDIDLDHPVLSEDDWQLTVGGLVENRLALSLEALRRLYSAEHLITLTCISNPVGGPLVGNARWTGVSLSSLLDMARPTAEARAVVARAADDYSETIPLDVVARDAPVVAFGMNGVLLPREHGYPARLLHPGRYGMRSVKWLTDLTLTSDQGAQGYWEKRGWDRQAVVRTGSRFDTPQYGSEVESPFTCAGIAWAGARGIQGVEISSDDGKTWYPATLEGELSQLAWRRWVKVLELPPGRYLLEVRAIDGSGAVQQEARQPPHPSGATGYHRVLVEVTGGSGG